MSATPVISTVLPLLFALIAGGSGFILMNKDFSNETNRGKIYPSLIGIAIFAIFYLLSSFHGIKLRTQDSLGAGEIAALNSLSYEKGLELVKVRSHLSATNLPLDLRDAILLKFIENLQNDKEAMTEVVARCLDLKSKLLSFSESLNGHYSGDISNADDAKTLQRLMSLSLQFSALGDSLAFCEGQQSYSKEGLQKYLSSIMSKARQLLNSDILQNSTMGAQGSSIGVGLGGLGGLIGTNIVCPSGTIAQADGTCMSYDSSYSGVPEGNSQLNLVPALESLASNPELMANFGSLYVALEDNSYLEPFPHFNDLKPFLNDRQYTHAAYSSPGYASGVAYTSSNK